MHNEKIKETQVEVKHSMLIYNDWLHGQKQLGNDDMQQITYKNLFFLWLLNEAQLQLFLDAKEADDRRYANILSIFIFSLTKKSFFYWSQTFFKGIKKMFVFAG